MFSKIKDQDQSYRNLVNGEWKDSASGKFIEIKSPIDQSFLGRVPTMTTAEVDEVIAYAKAAQVEWKNKTTSERAKVLYKAADLLEEHVEELAKIMMMEIAKDLKSCRSEISRTADFIRFSADSAKNMSGESIPGDSFPGFKNNKISIVKREPLGIVLAISPFNYPVNLAASKIAHRMR